MAAVTFFLDAVTPLTEGRADFLGDAQVFPLNSHPFESDGMSALLKIFQLFLVTFSAFIGENHRLVLRGGLWSMWQVIQWTPFFACFDSTQDWKSPGVTS
jgi:hypothetical protein